MVNMVNRENYTYALQRDARNFRFYFSRRIHLESSFFFISSLFFIDIPDCDNRRSAMNSEVDRLFSIVELPQFRHKKSYCDQKRNKSLRCKCQVNALIAVNLSPGSYNILPFW